MRFILSARNIDELRAKANGNAGARVRGRSQALRKLLEEQGETANPKFKAVWEQKAAGLQPFVELFEAAHKSDAELSDQEKAAREKYFADCDALWEAELRRVFATLEKEIVGPLCLGELQKGVGSGYLLTTWTGDQVSLADVHVAAYLTRLVTVSGGDGTKGGIEAVGRMGGFSVGEKVQRLWETLLGRASWQSLYGSGVF